MLIPGAHHRVYTHFHLFCGAGGGAIGFNRGHARHGQLTASLRCIGGVDSDASAIRDFSRLVGVPGTVLDLFDAQQYEDFHGRPPPASWRAATADDIRRAAHGESPDIVFLSAPCKGFSGLLNKTAAASPRYQALNRLTVRGIRLMLEAFDGQPPKLIVFENVPRIAQRGRALLEDIRHELEMAGYAVAETAHDCGVIGGLAQHRHRFLLVARHLAQVPPFLYEPPPKRVRAVGEVIGEMPLPDAPSAGPMHRLPRCTVETWIRLALIQPGKDARSLHGLDLTRLGIERVEPRAWHDGELGVVPWDRASGAIQAKSGPTNGAFNVGEVRRMGGWAGKGSYYVTPPDEPAHAVIAASSTGAGAFAMSETRLDSLREQAPRDWGGGELGVNLWDQPTGAVSTEARPSNGRYSVGDVRVLGNEYANIYRLVRYDEPAPSVTSGPRLASGALGLADVRPQATGYAVYGVQRYDAPSSAITAQAEVGAGPFSVGDIRLALKEHGDAFGSSGHYGVSEWTQASRAVTGSACHDNGYYSVGDIRLPLHERPDPPPVILSLWRSKRWPAIWNRPFTTLELAALQGYPWEDLMLVPLDGRSDSGWREHVGNSVPPPAAEAIASVMAHTLLLAELRVGFQLTSAKIWVRPLAIALSVAPGLA